MGRVIQFDGQNRLDGLGITKKEINVFAGDTIQIGLALFRATFDLHQVGYQTNLMLYTPGGYKFRDYLRVGIPLDMLFTVLAIWLISKFWPFRPG